MATIEIPAYRQIFSVGYLAQQCQLGVHTIRRIMEERGIQPALVINDVDHFDATAYLELLAWKKRKEQNGN